MSRALTRGFTLIEVLVSVFLLSVLAAFCYETLSYVQKSRENTAAAFARVRELELAMHFLTTDFEQLEPRPVRDVLGTAVIPALLADARSTDLVTLTKGGWPNSVGLPRSTLQRVTYTLENGTLIRQYPTVLDSTLANTPVRREILKDVVSIKIRYMDSSRTWQEQWPPLVANSGTGTGTGTGPANSMRPMAVEITVELKDTGKLVRVVEVPG